MPPTRRVFLFLQGPHGPFFRTLARMLRLTGAETWRMGFNRGDAAFWTPKDRYIPFTGPDTAWPACIRAALKDRKVTDLVLYGDTRPIHAEAIAAARALGITVHIFEEGYLRPYWITYERCGANGNSPARTRTIAGMTAALAGRRGPLPRAPARWGDMRQHIFYGALYHFCVMVGNRAYAAVPPHRDIAVSQELRLYLRRLALMPVHAAERMLATWRVHRGGYPYHLALLQLAHDASFRSHGPFASQTESIEAILEAFAEGAPRHHHLVFKTHPLEDGRTPIRADIQRCAQRLGLARRVHVLRGGKLARLLDTAVSAVTVTSTAAEQALWRGLPVKALGDAVYGKPELVSDQPLAAFFRAPRGPDAAAYQAYRRYLLETSQIQGSFYAVRGRRAAVRRLVDLMLDPVDPYVRFEAHTAPADTASDRDLPATPATDPPAIAAAPERNTGMTQPNRLI